MNLAYQLRPQTLDDYVGQEDLVGRGKLIRRMIESDTLFSIILWGPPGSGKTTLASIIAHEANADFHVLSAVSTGKEDLNKIVKTAKEQTLFSKKTILFIDEIHRWNKAQQDVLLPYVESGLITLIGATTENPSFEINSALLSRCKVFVLNSLSEADLNQIITRALTDKDRGMGTYGKTIDKHVRELMIRLSGGDARVLLNAVEMAVINYKEKKITEQIIKDIFQTRSSGLYDKKAEEHYNIISAFIKSIRGSDPDAALYYLSRMLEGGEDPKFIARRMIILASEDIGLADRGALIQANAGFEAVDKIGMPEAQLTLAHICLYLATAPKSRAVANALGRAKAAVYEHPNEPVPLHLRNAPTKLMKNLGYSKGYEWSDRHVGPKDNRSFLPDKLKSKTFYDKQP
ncbi:replication-associated recombination protein A [Candidatus Microgenomates bacterium]|nr:replication-associated recombination protein A [Candidatus Microgenomates bacterium]